MSDKASKSEAQDMLDPALLRMLSEAHGSVDAPAALSGTIRQSLLNRIAQSESGSSLDDALVTVRSDSGDWQAIAPKLKIKFLHRDSANGIASYLLRLAAGASIPAHPHAIDEECLVLEGDLSMADLHLQAGDYHLAPKGAEHATLRTRNGALLFLRGADPFAPQPGV